MGIIILRLLVICYVAGIIFLIISMLNRELIEKKQTLLGLFFFPILLFTKKGRILIKNIIKGENK